MKRNPLKGEQRPLRGEQMPMFPGADFKARVLLLELPEQHEREKDEPIVYSQAMLDLQEDYNNLFSRLAEAVQKWKEQGWLSGDNNDNCLS